MLKQLVIHNFQSHKHTVFNFAKGTTAIVGETQAGKSAALRALDQLRKNNRRGFRYHSTFSEDDETYIKATTYENDSITFRRTAQGATYLIEYANGKREQFKGFGAKVPDEVNRVLNISDSSIQQQLSAYYLILAPPSEVAKTLNTLTGAEQTEGWLSRLTTEVNTTKVQLNMAEKSLARTRAELETFKDFDKAENLAQELQATSVQIDKMQRELLDCDNALKQLEVVDKYIARLNAILKHEPTLNELLDLRGQCFSLQRQIAEIYEMLDRLDKIDDDIATTESEATVAVTKYLGTLSIDKICPVCYQPITDKQLKQIEKGLLADESDFPFRPSPIGAKSGQPDGQPTTNTIRKTRSRI